jgi:hypothetical protein
LPKRCDIKGWRNKFFDRVRHEVRMTVNIESEAFWNDVKPCILVDGYMCFGGSCCLHLAPWRWRQRILRNVG